MDTMTPQIPCPVAGRCGGCKWIMTPYPQQLDDKLAQLRDAWREAALPDDALRRAWIEPAQIVGGRQRVDVTFRRVDGAPVLGMWGAGGELVPVGACPMADPILQSWLVALAADPPPVDRLSLRLRAQRWPEGVVRGLWLDAANVDVKALLDEEAWLRRRMEEGRVEIGQRHKPLAEVDGALKLVRKPDPMPWFRARDGARLYGTIAGFSQIGHLANLAIVDAAMALAGTLARDHGARRWLELGAGNGNLTLALASVAQHVTAAEIDRVALRGLERTVAECGLEHRVSIVPLNMYTHDARLPELLDEADAMLVDPPRSGLGSFLDALHAHDPARRPRHLVYVSCYLDSFVEDTTRLVAMGYQPTRVHGMDQFPHTDHCEWFASFTLDPR